MLWNEELISNVYNIYLSKRYLNIMVWYEKVYTKTWIYSVMVNSRCIDGNIMYKVKWRLT